MCLFALNEIEILVLIKEKKRFFLSSAAQLQNKGGAFTGMKYVPIYFIKALYMFLQRFCHHQKGEIVDSMPRF